MLLEQKNLLKITVNIGGVDFSELDSQVGNQSVVSQPPTQDFTPINPNSYSGKLMNPIGGNSVESLVGSKQNISLKKN